jgi:hypothetical protein
LRRIFPMHMPQHTFYKKWWWGKPIADIFPKKNPLSIEGFGKKCPNSSPKSEPNMRKVRKSIEQLSSNLWFHHSLFVQGKFFYRSFSRVHRRFLHW